MKKIMFNDSFGLTQDVLDGLKTMTRRLIPINLYNCTDFKESPPMFHDSNFDWYDLTKAACAFKIGEIVAIAQSYKNAGVRSLPEEDEEFGCYDFPAEQTNGWTNKMFVRADLMPHQIHITNVRVERLQDISDEDCIKEGVVEVVYRFPTKAPQYITRYYPCRHLKECADKVGWGLTYATPQEAFAVLIDKVSGKGTWESNPFVFAYEFELLEDIKK